MYAHVADHNILGYHISYTNVSATLVVKSDLEHCEACNIMIENFARALIELTKIEATVNEVNSIKVLPDMTFIRPFRYTSIIMPLASLDSVNNVESVRDGWVARGVDVLKGNTLIKSEDENILDLVQEKYGNTRPVLVFHVGDLGDNADCAMYVGSCDVSVIKNRFNAFLTAHKGSRT